MSGEVRDHRVRYPRQLCKGGESRVVPANSRLSLCLDEHRLQEHARRQLHTSWSLSLSHITSSLCVNCRKRATESSESVCGLKLSIGGGGGDVFVERDSCLFPQQQWGQNDFPVF